MSIIEISSLYVYPLKSTAAVASEQLTLGRMGPQWDRRWMVVDGKGQFLTQRRYPLMCLISSRVTAEGIALQVAAGSELVVDCRALVDTTTVTVWGDEVQALDCGQVAADWLTTVLKTPCRLVYMPDDCYRQVDPSYAIDQETVSFADGFPLLLISEASLAALNQRLSSPVAMQRFRPNIVVRGCEAFAEDRWRHIEIAGLRFTVAKPCSRCTIPAIDPATGSRHSEVLRELASFRRGDDNQVYFGQNLLHHDEGDIAVGDRVQLHD